ncbi:Rpn family recombination-promoting nuclease/putative transposase [Anaerolineales bacterium HSG25]|nr:Rpn family recombination-promoting nuclease/putative transposase [Anaerolineales bacterium HSG25]
MKFVTPRNDVAFKKIFGSEDKTEILIGFLNAVLDLTGDKAIQSITILNPYQTPRLESLKLTILDVRAVDKRGVTFIVEMQIAHVAGAKKRFLYYTSKAYSSQISRGEDYPKLNQVIFIGVLDFVLFETDKPRFDRYVSRHQILDTETHQQEFTDLEFNFIELPKFKKKEGELETLLDKWVYFIKHADDLEVIPSHAVGDSALESAYHAADQFGWNKKDLEAYDYRGIKIQDERGALQLAEERGERRKALETARNLLKMGLRLEQISEATGLLIDELNQL